MYRSRYPQETRSIYILLMRTDTYFSRLIHFLSAEEYTHASLCLDGSLQQFYSFGRKNSYLMFPAGFVQEELDRGIFQRFPEIPCALYELQVLLPVYEKIVQRIMLMRYSQSEYPYNCLGVLLCKLGLAHQRQYHYFCSQFVADVLQRSGALEFSKEASLVQPGDFRHLPQLQLRYQGQLNQLRSAF